MDLKLAPYRLVLSIMVLLYSQLMHWPCRFLDNFVNAHVTQQSHLIFNTRGESAVDYIGRTEMLAEDWSEIIAIVRERTGLNVPDSAMPPSRSPPTTEALSSGQHPCLSEKVAELEQLDPLTSHAIAMQHAMDVTLLGYL